jgi:UPF0176 protein
METGHESVLAPPVDYKFLLYYHYVPIADPQALCNEQLELCHKLELKGRIRISSEGINGTIGGSTAAIQEYIAVMDGLKSIHSESTTPIHWKISGLVSTYPPERQFLEWLSVKVTKEVVSLDLPAAVKEAVAATESGTHLDPCSFHNALKELSSSPESASSLRLLDIRNHYEVNIGSFEIETPQGGTITAINPMTRAVRNICQ